MDVFLFGRILVVYIPFISMVKFHFLAQFPVDHFSHPVVSSLDLLFCQFAIFAYYVINRFVSMTTQAKPLRIIDKIS